MMPGKHQRSKGKCQDLCLKVRDPSQSFFVAHTLCMNYVTNTFLLAPQYGLNNYCVMCRVKGKKENKNIQQKTLSGFITIPLY